jgi:glycosyltransferase involved in cell wall biosynthesis
MSSKKKILMISDHALSTSGVGVQSRHLINGLVEKGDWTVRQLGAAIKHADYTTIKVNDDFIIKPIDGFGNRDMLRLILAQEKPDVLLIFTDPRFFLWLFEMADEIHQVCPIAWWHVWDNRPTPKYNYPLYEETDAINCHSHLTYQMCAEDFPEKSRFIPHALPQEMYFPIPEVDSKRLRSQILGDDRADHFVGFWINRNAKRKRPNDLLAAWARFLELLEEKHGHKKATLLLHTDPMDAEGPNLFVTTETLGIINNVYFSRDRLGFDKINILHNISDFYTCISFAEGFGLGTLEAMQCGKPIIATKTGGMTRQVVDHRDGTENGIALDIELSTMVGSQQVPYIYEDYVSVETIAQSFLKLYEMGPEKRRELGQKARDYVMSEFALQKTIDDWHDSLNETIDKFKSTEARWTLETL